LVGFAESVACFIGCFGGLVSQGNPATEAGHEPTDG